MPASDQLRSLIQSFSDNDDARFFATAMQIAAEEARKGNDLLAQDLKKLIDKSKVSRRHAQGLIKSMPVTQAQKELSDLLELIHPKERWKDLVLSSSISQRLERIIDEQHKLEILRQHNLSPRKKLLFTGPPGCGKTLSARVLASELKMPLFIIRLDGLISRYMGESIAKLRLIFDAMHQFRAVYLFDEFDSIGATRQNNNEVGEIKRVLNTFLLQIEKDDSNSLIIAATNLPNVLDSALFRRFDDIINYSLPDETQIQEMYRKEFAEVTIDANLDLNQLTQYSLGLSYAEIHKICEDLKKDVLLYGTKIITENQILTLINHRKNPF